MLNKPFVVAISAGNRLRLAPPRDIGSSVDVKIAILGTRGIPARYGGFETFAEELSVRLAERGYQVTVYCEQFQELSTYRGVRLEYLPKFRVGAATPIIADAWALCMAARRHDVAYILGYSSPFVFWLPRLLGTKVWVNMDGIEWTRSKWGPIARTYIRAMEAIAVRAADRVIADAVSIRDFLTHRHAGMAPCEVIPYGAPVIVTAPDSAPLTRWGLTSSSYYLVVCRLEPENHVLEIIRGFLNAPTNRQLVIVGNDKAATNYVKALKDVAKPQVRMIGPIYDRSLLQCLRFHAMAYLHGHSVGGTNPSLLEALGCGNMIIAHDNVFNREVCGNIATYFKTENEIPHLIELVEAQSLAHRQSSAIQARERIRNTYSWDSVTDKYVALLQG